MIILGTLGTTRVINKKKTKKEQIRKRGSNTNIWYKFVNQKLKKKIIKNFYLFSLFLNIFRVSLPSEFPGITYETIHFWGSSFPNNNYPLLFGFLSTSFCPSQDFNLSIKFLYLSLCIFF